MIEIKHLTDDWITADLQGESSYIRAGEEEEAAEEEEEEEEEAKGETQLRWSGCSQYPPTLVLGDLLSGIPWPTSTLTYVGLSTSITGTSTIFPSSVNTFTVVPSSASCRSSFTVLIRSLPSRHNQGRPSDLFQLNSTPFVPEAEIT